MDSDLLPTHILSSLSSGIQIIFNTPAREGRTKWGLPALPRKAWNRRYGRTSVQMHRSGGAERGQYLSAPQPVTVPPMGARLT